MITIRSANFGEIFILIAFISGLAFGAGMWLFGEPMLAPGMAGIVAIGSGVLFGGIFGAMIGWRMQSSRAEIPIAGNEQNLREAIKKMSAQEGYQTEFDQAALRAHKKRRSVQLICWEAQIRFEQGAVVIEGPAAYVRDLKKIVEMAQVAEKTFSHTSA